MKFTIPSITITLPTINWKTKLLNATSPDQPRTTLKQKLHAATAPKPTQFDQGVADQTPPFTLQ